MEAELGATTLPPRTVCGTSLVLGKPGRLLAMAAPWLSAESMPGGVPVQPLPSGVTAELINPSPTDPTLNTFTLGVEVEIAVLVGAEVGTVEEVRLFSGW